MKFSNIVAATAALSASVGLASPLLDEKRDLVCLAQTVIINLITLNHGQAFCSAYLGIQTSTVLTTTTKKTTTTQTLPPATVTKTVVTGTETRTLTSLITTLATATSTVDTTQTLTATNTITITSTTTGVTVKRSPEPLIDNAQIDARNPPPIPPYLSIFAASKISSACSCLSLPTPSTTVTSTVQQTSTATSTPSAVTSQVQTVTFVTVTTTAVNTITQIETLTNTISTTTTATTTTTVIVTETPSPPSYCDQMPIPGPYAFIDGGRVLDAVFIQDSTKADCCRACWESVDCVAFSFQGPDPEVESFCYYLVSDGPAVSGIANPPPTCPSGVETQEQLDLEDTGGFFSIASVGPCDLAGAHYVTGG
ncbi:uncharacterized protein Bfra_004996 [Botrytis fragariae]|uniref:Apple domain-containing protein n=1 Tax=Botrytis fragariae TaxID=1964551 RepID=A0A8H6ATT6_9HELO|nr:uncharacterized protein Bfra_004996 [Botrytis fragariae]KAF5873534.1 hypothetical protein Bfra_004996 [Botrytis fragariae]